MQKDSTQPKTAEDYEPYGEEWVKEMMKLPKEFIIKKFLRPALYWKQSAIQVMADMQEIAKELQLPLGATVHDKILPGIKALKARIRELESGVQ